MAEINERKFDLGTVLSITTGKLYTQMNNVYEILSYLCNKELFTHQLSSARKIAEPYILAKYPQLKDIGKDTVINSWDDVYSFLESQKKTLGDDFILIPMPQELCQQIDSDEETIEINTKRTK